MASGYTIAVHGSAVVSALVLAVASYFQRKHHKKMRDKNRGHQSTEPAGGPTDRIILEDLGQHFDFLRKNWLWILLGSIVAIISTGMELLDDF